MLLNNSNLSVPPFSDFTSLRLFLLLLLLLLPVIHESHLIHFLWSVDSGNLLHVSLGSLSLPKCPISLIRPQSPVPPSEAR